MRPLYSSQTQLKLQREQIAKRRQFLKSRSPPEPNQRSVESFGKSGKKKPVRLTSLIKDYNSQIGPKKPSLLHKRANSAHSPTAAERRLSTRIIPSGQTKFTCSKETG